MASGSFYLTRTSGSTYCSYRVDWSSVSKGSAVNGSKVTVAVYILKSSSSSANTNGTTNTTVSVDSWSQSENNFKFDVAPGGSCLLFAKDYDYVTHNADGSKSITISVSIGGNIVGASGSANCTLDLIPREASVSAGTATIGSKLPIIITTPSTSLNYTLTWAFGNLSGTIASNISATTYNWTLPDSLYTQIPNAKTGVGSITCKTYSGSTLVGSKSCTFYANVNENAVQPTLSPTVVDQGSGSTTLTGDSSKLIKYYNDAHVTFNASASKSATISSRKVTCGGKSRTSDGILSNVENGTFTFSVTDSRGYTVSKTVTKTMINYIPLTCNATASSTLSSDNTVDINLTIDGNYFDGSFGAIDNKLTVEYRYKINEDEYGDWIPATVTPSNGRYSTTATIADLVYTDTCTVQARAIDELYKVHTGYITTSEKQIVITPVFDWSKDDFNFNVPVHCSNGFTYSVSKESSKSITIPRIITGTVVINPGGEKIFKFMSMDDIESKFESKFGTSKGVSQYDLGVILTNGDKAAYPHNVLGASTTSDGVYAHIDTPWSVIIRINYTYIVASGW